MLSCGSFQRIPGNRETVEVIRALTKQGSESASVSTTNLFLLLSQRTIKYYPSQKRTDLAKDFRKRNPSSAAGHQESEHNPYIRSKTISFSEEFFFLW